MKPFYRNIVTIGIFLTVMLMILGTASALELSVGGILNGTNSVPRASGTLDEISSDPVTVGGDPVTVDDTSNERITLTNPNESTTPTSNVGTLSSQTITATVTPVDSRTTIETPAELPIIFVDGNSTVSVSYNEIFNRSV